MPPAAAASAAALQTAYANGPRGLQTLFIAVLVFCVMILIVRNESPVHIPHEEAAPVRPVKALDIPIYVINLQANTQRLKTFSAFIADSDLKDQRITRLDAVDGKTLDLEKVVAKSAMPALTHTIMTDSRTSHEQLTVGAAGCYLSHMLAWEKIAKSGKPFGIVFEDDAEPEKNLLRYTLAAMEKLPKNWDILLLGTACLAKCPDVKGAPLKRVTSFVRFHAYAMSRKGAQFLTGKEAKMLPMSMQVDWALSKLATEGKLKIFVTKRFLADSGWQGTTIQRPVYSK